MITLPISGKPDFEQTDGIIDDEIVKKEVLELVLKMTVDHPDIRAILLECNMLPPYAKAVQNVTGLPVFDFKHHDQLCSLRRCTERLLK